MKMRQINELHADLASFLLNCARKKHFGGVRAEILLSLVIALLLPCAGPILGYVQKYYCPNYCIAAILCRASFRVCAEILVLGRIFTSELY